MFLVKYKNENEAYAMKVIEKSEGKEKRDKEEQYSELIERKVGLLGKQCRFIVQLVSCFHSRVSLNITFIILSNNYSNFYLSLIYFI